MNASRVIRAVAAVWAELPELVGDPWPSFQRELLEALRGLDAPDADTEALLEKILEAFARHAAAYERLVRALAETMPERGLKGVGDPLGAGKDDPEEPVRCCVRQVYYATDRNRTGDQNPKRFYGGERGELGFGVAEVSIPDDFRRRRKGELTSPRWWRLEFRENPQKHVILLSVEALDRASCVARISSGVRGADVPEALVFIHGYSVSFEDAARRAAQIAYDLEFDGVPLLYSWPSEASLLKYFVDRNNSSWTAPHFREFLELALEETGAETVHVIAHSMGNEVLAEFLRSFDPTKLAPGAAKLRQVVFAAPDIDADTFKTLAKDFRGSAERFTLYASAEDWALKASKEFQKYARAGDASEGIVIAPGVDTIDATAVTTGFLKHSYVGDNDSILADIFNLLRHGSAPGERFGLRKDTAPEGEYWVFQA